MIVWIIYAVIAIVVLLYCKLVKSCGHVPDPRKPFLLLLFIIYTIVMVALSLCSCARTVYVPITSTKTEYKYKAQKDSFNLINILNKRDSVYIRDSVVKRYSDKGELLSSEIWRWREKYSDSNELYKVLKAKFDSISSIKQDTIRVPYPVDKEVKQSLNWYEKLCIWGFSALLMIGIGYVIKKFIIK